MRAYSFLFFRAFAPIGFMCAVLLAGCKPASEDENTANMEGEGSSATVEASDNAFLAANGPDVVPLLGPPGDITFEAVRDTQQAGTSINGMLRNGTPVPLTSKEWAASFVTNFQTADGPASCTSAMVGPGIMLTAAHCVPETGKIRFSFGSASFDLGCAQHPKWLSGEDPSADFALCAVTAPATHPFVPPAGFRYETVDTGPMAQATQAPVILTGFGCTSDAVADRRVDSRYRIGKNVIVETSEKAPPRMYSDVYYRPSGQQNNLITADTGANICPGDSGGPAFTAGPNGTGPRRIIGVNSRVFFDRSTHERYGASLISSTGGTDFILWARKWLNDRHLAACGITGAPSGCR